MKRWFEDALQAFINSDMGSIKDYTLKFAQEITRALLNEEKYETEQLIDSSIEVRSKLQSKERIKKTKEFYYGYWYAYENIANRMIDYKDINDDIHTIIELNENLRILINFLGIEKAAKQKDIAECLGHNPNELANFMETDYVKRADVLTKNKVGRSVIYSLNAKGRKYFKDQKLSN
ncbi:MAG TPA: hypothetical protein GXZ90_09150 [Clostridiales bacterium]|nr:hypothetical protein [Clostridiales bacterium]